MSLNLLSHSGIRGIDELPGRETEFNLILDFLKSFILTSISGHTLYISGPPGTGKTVTVKTALHELRKSAKKNHIEDYKVVFVNGLEVQTPVLIFQEIYKQFYGVRKSPSAHVCLEKLSRSFNSKIGEKSRCLLIVDEFDQLLTRDQKVLYSILEWPLLSNSNLALIIISNKMNIRETIVGKCASRLGQSGISFNAYDKSQMLKIFHQQLGEQRREFESSALDFAAIKVCRYSGDIRQGLLICKHALLMMREIPKRLIKIDDLRDAEAQMTGNMTTSAVRKLPVYHKLFIMCLVLAINAKSGSNNNKDGNENNSSSRLYVEDTAASNVHCEDAAAMDVVIPLLEIIGRFETLVTQWSSSDPYENKCLHMFPGVSPPEVCIALCFRLMEVLESDNLIQRCLYIPEVVKPIVKPANAKNKAKGKKSRQARKAKGGADNDGDDDHLSRFNEMSDEDNQMKATVTRNKRELLPVIDDKGGDIGIRLIVEKSKISSVLHEHLFCSRYIQDGLYEKKEID